MFPVAKLKTAMMSINFVQVSINTLTPSKIQSPYYGYDEHKGRVNDFKNSITGL